MNVCHPGKGERKPRIERYRLIVVVEGLSEILDPAPPAVEQPAQVKLVSLRVLCRALGEFLFLRTGDFRRSFSEIVRVMSSCNACISVALRV